MREIVIAMLTIAFAVGGTVALAGLFVDSSLVGIVFVVLWLVGVCAAGTIALMV